MQLPTDPKSLVKQRSMAWQRKERSDFSTSHKGALGTGMEGCEEERNGYQQTKLSSVSQAQGKGSELDGDRK